MHSIRTKLFLSHLLVICLPLLVVAAYLHTTIEGHELAAAESTMAAEARVLARLGEEIEREAAREGENGSPALAWARHAPALAAAPRPPGEGPSPHPLHFRVFDARGRVLFDSGDPANAGRDFSAWNDVRDALRGAYGSRATLEEDRSRLVLHVTLPIAAGGRVAGAVSVYRPTTEIRRFLSSARRDLVVSFGLAVFLSLVVAYLITRFVTGPIRQLIGQVADVKSGARHKLPLVSKSRDEVGDLARAFSELALKLEGHTYAERLVADLSHEIKTPLAAIKGAAGVLEDGAMDDPENRMTFVRNIKNEADRMFQLVKDLLEMFRVDAKGLALDLAPCDLTGLVEKVLGRYRYPEKVSGVEIRFRNGLPDSVARVDAKRIDQVLVNLLNNALDFTPRGGRIDVEIGRRGADLSIAVRDTGVGIPDRNLSRIFERFFTTERPESGQKGTGLGLSITESIVKAHGGRIEVRSEAGKGSEFVVLLPAGP